MTPEQLQERQMRLGASDIAAIMGLSPFTTGYEVALEKRGRILPDKGTKSTRAGTLLEPSVLDYAEQQEGPLRRNVLRWAPDTIDFPLASTLDAEIEASGIPVEAKTSGIEGPIYGHWGEPDTDEIPDYYLVQASVQILCTGADLAYVYALLGGRGFVRFTVPRDEPLLRTMVDFAAEWWHKHVVQGIEPEQREPVPLEVVKRLRREADKRIVLDDKAVHAVARWEEAKEAAKAAKDAVDEHQAGMLLHLGDAEAGLLPDGRELTYFEQRRAGYVVSDGKHRVTRIRKART